MASSGHSPSATRLPLETRSSSYNALSPVQTHLTSSRFRTHSPSYPDEPQSLKERILRNVEKAQNHFSTTYNRLSPSQRVLAVIAAIVILVLSILFLVFNERIFGFFASFAQRWRDLTGGWLILWFLVVGVAFPPMIGYSSSVTAAGFVYGFPKGWFIAATATVVGSTVSFIVCRTVLRRTVERLTASDTRFAALTHVIKHDGLKLLIMIRFCPLPYSLSNGAIATIPTVNWTAFALATAAASPKLLLPIYVGGKLADIAENGGKMDAATKAISYISIIVGSAAGIGIGWVVYRQTQARAQQLENEERSHSTWADLEEATAEYVDHPNSSMPLSTTTTNDDNDDIRIHTTHDGPIEPFSDNKHGRVMNGSFHDREET